MDELERMLRGDRERLGEVDSHATLAGVLNAGRRRLWRRRAISVGATAALVVVTIALLPVAASPSISVNDVVGPGGSSVSASPRPSGPATESGSRTPSPTESVAALGAPEDQETVTTEVAATPSQEPPSGTPSPEEPPTPEWVPLQLTVTTDADSYAQGADVEIVVRACNETERTHDEWYADARSRFRVQVITADDRNIAFGQFARQDDAPTEVWAPGQCDEYVLTWDQTEGPFEQDGGQQAWEGDHRIELSWSGVQPPPEGMDPGLYDPVGRESIWSAPFAIEPASLQPSPSPSSLL